MIQIYNADNRNFDSNGNAVLQPISCDIDEILKGTWVLTLENPPDDNANLIKSGAVIKADTNIGKGQLFRIYTHEKSDRGVTAKAYPIFYDCRKEVAIIDKRPTNKTGNEALQILTQGTQYTAESNIRSSRTAYFVKMDLLQAINGDDENSFINRWGGEPIYNNYHVTVNKRAGGDYGARVAFGYNLQGITEHVNFDNVITRIIPEAYNGYMLEGDKPWVDSPNIKKYPIVYTKLVQYSDIKLQEDCTGEDEKGYETLEELRAALIERAKQDFRDGVDKPEVSYDIDFVPLENTVEYEDIKDLVKINLGDSIDCENKNLDIVTKGRVTSLTYDCVLKRISALHIGDIRSNYFDKMSLVMQAAANAITENGGLKGEKIMGIMNAAITQLRAQSTRAKKADVVAMLCEDTDPDSEDFGAMCIGTKGFMIAAERTPDGTDWDWHTFGTGRGFLADCIIAGIILSKNYNEETGEGFMFNLDNGELQAGDVTLKGIFSNMENGLGVKIQNRRMEFFVKNAISAIIAAVSDGSMAFQLFKGGKYTFIITDTDGKDYYPLTIEKDGITGKFKAGATGRAEFSDGTYLQFTGGVCVGGKTKEGEF